MKKQSVIKKVLLVLVTLTIMILGVNVLTADTNWPKKISLLDGWHGLTLVKGKRCPVCYSIIFPKNFGLHNDEEFSILINLPAQRLNKDMKYDLDGPLFDDEDVMDHLLYLALKKRFDRAGKVILFPEKHSLHLGVSTSEEAVGNYIIPLLENYHDLHEIIHESEYALIAKWISDWSAYQGNFQKADGLIDILRERNYKELANVINVQCQKEKDLMEKHSVNTEE